MTVAGTLELVRGFRRRDAETPVVLMGYYNPIYRYGAERFLDDAKAAGVDGLIVVDLPPEEDDELCLPALAKGLCFIRLATPTTDDRRLPKVLGQHQRLHLLRVDDRHHRRRRAGGRCGRPGGRAPAPPYQPAGRRRLRHPHRRAGGRGRAGSPMPRWSAPRWSIGSRARSTSRAAPAPGLVRALHEQVKALAEGVRGARR